jgi:hypothetical protein
MAVITTLTYPTSATSTGTANANVLKQELEDASLSVSVGDVVVQGTTITITLSGNASDADETAVDAVVAAHDGTGFTAVPQTVTSEGEASDDTGSEVEKANLQVGPLEAGTYNLQWYMELATTTTTGTSGAQGHLYVDKNGGGAVERGQDNAPDNQWRAMGGGFPFTAVAGDSYEFSLTFERIGVSGNAARARRGRIGVTRIG